MNGSFQLISDMEAYTYEESLGSEHFRILTLQNAGKDEPLRCSLETLPIPANVPPKDPRTGDEALSVDAEVPDPPTYEAISYVWGSTENMQHINCDEQKLPVTPSVAIALRYLRYQHAPRRLWIDQICINQADLDERSAQVRIMGKIYQGAQQIMVWLGEASATSDRAIQFAHELTAAISAFERSFPEAMVVWKDFGKPLKSTNLHLPPEDGEEWIGLSDLLSNDWFSRVWIIQEVSLKDNVFFQCGDSYLSWAIFEQLYMMQAGRHPAVDLRLHAERENKFCLIFLYLINYLKGTRSMILMLEEAVNLLARQQASDPRDLIYAALPLVREPSVNAIRPDYNQDIEEVYTNFTKLMLGRLGRRYILNFVQLSVESALHMPSWAVDWSNRWKEGRQWRHRMDHRIFSTSGTCTDTWSFRDHDKVLQIRGRCIDKLSALGAFTSGLWSR